jgi:hypothetical protein
MNESSSLTGPLLLLKPTASLPAALAGAAVLVGTAGSSGPHACTCCSSGNTAGSMVRSIAGLLHDTQCHM